MQNEKKNCSQFLITATRHSRIMSLEGAISPLLRCQNSALIILYLIAGKLFHLHKYFPSHAARHAFDTGKT